MTVRSAIGDIPKLYIPISQSDVPLRVHNLIQNELTRVNIISLATRPIPAETCRPGWGQPGTALGNTNFKAAVVATLEIVVKNVAKLGKEYEFDRSVSVRIWMEKLVAKGFVDKRIARAYVEGYERARFGYEEIEEKEYLEFMKLITVLVTRLPKA
ncbi:hypothetical protein BKA69DRAFT_52538 [Paraphysoderma sedebokerense]|nr:hypothetical protein BKA69DRAFT_52538 [Paraphysoderma sedebokerense]